MEGWWISELSALSEACHDKARSLEAEVMIAREKHTLGGDAPVFTCIPMDELAAMDLQLGVPSEEEESRGICGGS